MNLLLIVSVFSLADAHLGSGLLSIAITRHHQGDIFTARGGKCYKDFCLSLSSGTAAPTGNGDCECQCGPSRPVFRDDLTTCVDDIQECTLVEFASSAVRKKVPYVFLPLKGQIVNPSADIVVPGEAEAPVCVVSGGQFLGQSGWVKLRNSSGTESPFRLFRDEGRTYLQWLGEASLRMAMEGRIILVHLMCKDASALEERKIYTPCVGFRVAGKPSVKEMVFTTDVHLKEEPGGGLSVREYVAIGVCSLLLAVVYIAAVVLYLYIRKRNHKNGSKKSGKSATLTLGEEGVIKSNPLLQAARHLSSGGLDNAGYVSESNSCCSDADRTSDLLCLDNDDDPLAPQNMQTSAIIHPCDMDFGETTTTQDPNNIEKLPEENVSIVETLEAREHPETVQGMTCGNGRRKLYFNPSYFEPDLLKAPPPAAIEFLVKIREVIAIAKHKMSAKKFSPSLLGIPEEDSASRTDHCSSLARGKGSPAPKDLSSKAFPRFPTSSPTDFLHFPKELSWPSDAKQKIIRKWLEDVPVMMAEAEECKVHKEKEKQTKRASVRETREDSGREGLSSPPARQDRRKSKARAPPVPPLRREPPQTTSSGGGRFESAPPPHPPPMPLFTLASDQVPRVQAKDYVPPAIAKNLMDAVIQELSGLKKDGKKSKAKDLEEMNTEIRQEVKEGAEAERGHAEQKSIGAEDPSPEEQRPTTAGAPQDDHEYEIILLNSDQVTSEGKDMKIYNLPELLSKNERSEGYSLVSEVYVNDGYSCCSEESPSSSWCNMSIESDNVHYDVPTERPGRLTIHVNDSPERYKVSATESDNFEPDTLDRKPRRSRLNGKRTTDDTEKYSNQKFHDMECHLSSNDSDKFTDSLERPKIMLKTNGTFNRTPLDNNIDNLLRNFSWNKVEGFGSLREIYEAKARNHKRRNETTSLIDSGHSDHDRISTLSWGEEKRNKLLHRGIVLHITEEGSRRHKRTARTEARVLLPPKLPSRPPKPSPSPTPRSRSASPIVRSTSTPPASPPTTSSAPLPPPRSVPPSPPPRSTSSPSPQPTPRSTSASPVLPDRPKTPATPPSRTSPSPSPAPYLPPLPQHITPSPLHLPPPRPPKSLTLTPLLPPRTAKPPLPPKHPKRYPKPNNFASRPLPPLPRPSKQPHSSPLPPTDHDNLSAGSFDSLNSSDYEPFYTLPYPDHHNPTFPTIDSPKKPTRTLTSPDHNSHRSRLPNKQPSNTINKLRPEDSGYLSTDSDSFCPHLAFSPPCSPPTTATPTHNSDTDESFCDGASESGAESIATDSFFYGNFNNSPPNPPKAPPHDGDARELRPCALRLSDIEVNSDTERHSLPPIMVRP